MAKETMQAVSEAEKRARQTLLHAKEESERLVAEAKEQSKKLIADAEKEAAKKSEVLLGVARADGEKLKKQQGEKLLEEQEGLKQAAKAAEAQAVEKIREIVLGQKER